VLSGVTLAVRDGETVSIVGTSGVGKSVLLKTTIGLLRPDRGDVRLDGVSVTNANREQLEAIRRKVGYVFQYAALFDSMTILENVAEGLPEAALRSLSGREVTMRVCQALEEVNLEPREVLTKLPAELSGGMRKRVGVARAIIGRPHIVLYDEPVTGLDPVNTATIARLIVKIGQTHNVTSVIVTHDIEGALEISDRIALLDRGRVHFVGDADEFRSSREPLVRAFVDRRAAAETSLRLLERS